MVDKESVGSGVDVIAHVDIWNKDVFPRIRISETLRRCARLEQTPAVSAHKDAIIESIVGRNVKRVVPNCPVANTVVDREIIPLAVPPAVILRADVKETIISQTAVELVGVRTFGCAGLGGCRAGTFGVNRGLGAGLGGASLTLGFGGGRHGSQFRGTFLDGRSENEARENGEGEKDGRETHGVVARWLLLGVE